MSLLREEKPWLEICMEHRQEQYGITEHPNDEEPGCEKATCKPTCPLDVLLEQRKAHRYPPYSLRSHIDRNCDHRR